MRHKTLFSQLCNLSTIKRGEVQLLSDRRTGTTYGLVPIPKPTPIPRPKPLPEPNRIPDPTPIQQASVLPPFIGTEPTAQVLLPRRVVAPDTPHAIADEPVVTPATASAQTAEQAAATAQQAGGPVPSRIPPPAPRRMPRMLPPPGHFWRRTARIRTSLPSPADFWRGTPTTSQIYLPAPEVFWGR